MKKSLSLFALCILLQPLFAQDWSLTGNAGTNPATHFLGTTDNQPLTFRRNNVQAGLIDGYSNTFYGSSAGLNNVPNVLLFQGQSNTGIGAGALRENTTGKLNTALGSGALIFNTTGTANTALGEGALGTCVTAGSNTAVGHSSLANCTGSANTAVGDGALATATSVSNSVALGAGALSQNKAGSRGVAIGYWAMFYADNTTSTFNNQNVAVGFEALRGSTTPASNTGNRNTAIGYQALTIRTSGDDNTAIGNQTMYSATTGSANTAVGHLALLSLTSGNNNTGIGRYANVSTGTLTNATALGYNASVNASNKVRLGNSSITVVEGQVPYTSPSDARFKRDVEEDVLGLDLILKLRPVSYAFDRLAFAKHVKEDVEGRESELTQASRTRTVGFLAQEVEGSVKETGFAAFDVVHVPEGPTDNYGLAYAQFVVPLVKAVQELHAENEALKEEQEALRNTLSDRVAQLEGSGRIDRSTGQLLVYPVPARDQVRIDMDQQLIGRSATLELIDPNGQCVQRRTIASLGASMDLQLSTNLPSGSYTVVLRAVGEAPRSAHVVIAR
jgi:hypothetical protein